MNIEQLEQKVHDGGALTDDETRYLFSEMHQDPDRIIHLIASGNMELVKKEAKKLFRSPEYEDLNQEGILALYEAVLHYDPTRSAPFAVYARVCVRNRLQQYLHREGRLISLPWYVHDKKGYEMQKKAVGSLDIQLSVGEKDEGVASLLDLLPSEENLEEQVLRHLELESVLDGVATHLTPREREIVADRYGLYGKPELTRTEIRKKYHVCRQYVSAAEKRALKKLREKMINGEEEK